MDDKRFSYNRALILERLTKADGVLSRREIRDIFSRHLSKADIDRLLESLKSLVEEAENTDSPAYEFNQCLWRLTPKGRLAQGLDTENEPESSADVQAVENQSGVHEARLTIGWYQDDFRPAIFDRPKSGEKGFYVHHETGITNPDVPVRRQWLKYDGEVPPENQRLESGQRRFLVRIQPRNTTEPVENWRVGASKMPLQWSPGVPFWECFEALPRPRYPRPGCPWTEEELRAFDAANAVYHSANEKLSHLLFALRKLPHFEEPAAPTGNERLDGWQDAAARLLQSLRETWKTAGVPEPTLAELKAVAGVPAILAREEAEAALDLAKREGLAAFSSKPPAHDRNDR